MSDHHVTESTISATGEEALRSRCARLEKELEEQKRRFTQSEAMLHLRNDLALALGAASELKEALAILIESVLRIDYIDTAGIYLYEEATDELVLIHHYGMSETILEKLYRFGSEDLEYHIAMRGGEMIPLSPEEAPVLQQAIESGVVHCGGCLPIRYEGQTIAALVIGTRSRDEFPVMSVAAVKAISAEVGGAISRIKAEEALRLSERRYRTVIEDQTEMLCRFTPDFRLSFVNPAYCRFFGKKREELIGSSFLTLIPQEERDAVRRFFASLTRENPVTSHEHQAIAADGAVRWQQWANRALFGKDGRIEGFQAVGRDITTRKRAELELQQAREKLEERVRRRTLELRNSMELLEKTLNSLRDAVFIIDDKSARILQCNPAVERIFGYSEAELIDELTAVLHVDDLSLAGFRERLFAAVASEGYLYLPEFHMKRRDGTVFPTEHIVTPLLGEAGGRIGWVSVVRDISRRRELESALLEISEREKRLIGQEIHDGLCQQLAGVLCLCRAADKRLENGETVGTGDLREIIDYLGETLEQAHDLSRGLSPLSLSPEAFVPTLEELAGRMRRTFGVGCRVRYAGKVLIENPSWALHLYRIAQEAVHNALQHADAESVEMELQPQGETFCLRIVDDGCGIGAAAAVGPDLTADQTADRQSGQQGLGLKTMEYRAGLMGGTVTVAPGVTGGTVVECLVPSRTEIVCCQEES